MFEWIPLYATQIGLVDEQHQRLFEMANEIAAKMEAGDYTADTLEKAMDDLLDYAYQHFVDEERLMARYDVDERHQKQQRMAHHAFIYDVKNMRASWDDVELLENFDKIIQFITSWLVYHTLRTDIQLGFQVDAIKHGTSPSDAYEQALVKPLDYRIYEKVIEAVVHLWTDALERVKELEGSEEPELKAPEPETARETTA